MTTAAISKGLQVVVFASALLVALIVVVRTSPSSKFQDPMIEAEDIENELKIAEITSKLLNISSPSPPTVPPHIANEAEKASKEKFDVDLPSNQTMPKKFLDDITDMSKYEPKAKALIGADLAKHLENIKQLQIIQKIEDIEAAKEKGGGDKGVDHTGTRPKSPKPKSEKVEIGQAKLSLTAKMQLKQKELQDNEEALGIKSG